MSKRVLEAHNCAAPGNDYYTYIRLPSGESIIIPDTSLDALAKDLRLSPHMLARHLQESDLKSTVGFDIQGTLRASAK